MVAGFGGDFGWFLVSLLLPDNLHHILIAVLFTMRGTHRINLVDRFSISTDSVFFLAVCDRWIGNIQGAHRGPLPLGLVVGGRSHAL